MVRKNMDTSNTLATHLSIKVNSNVCDVHYCKQNEQELEEAMMQL